MNSSTTILADLVGTAQSDSRIPVIGATILLAAGTAAFFLRPPKIIDDSGIARLPDWVSSITAWSFFTKRHDFMFNGFLKTGQDLFQFRFLQHTVVCISGEEGRKVFHNDKDLDFTQGYQILLGGVSSLFSCLSS